jgi:HEPN domain-containing protein
MNKAGLFMDNQEAAQGWLNYAASDLAAASFLYNGMIPAPIEVICYLCEQSAEKYLKGFLTLQGVQPRKTHDLEDLGTEAAQYFKGFADILDGLSVLTVYGVNVRYPYSIEVTEDDMSRALANAKSIEALTLSQINKVFPTNNQ